MPPPVGDNRADERSETVALLDKGPPSPGYLPSQDALMNVEVQPHSVQFCRTAASVYTRRRVTNDPPRPAIYPRPDLSVAVAFTWPKRAEVVAPWRSLNFYSGFMRFACRRGRAGEEEAGRGEDLMMMYRGRAAKRCENGRRRVPPLGLRSPGNERRV